LTFIKCIKALTIDPFLHPAIWGESFELMCDALGYVVGVLLGQRIDRKPHVIDYVSHT